MADPLDFYGPHLKTERAKHHIDHLEDVFRGYVRASKKAVAPKFNLKVRERQIGGSFPRHTPTILGDALHNLRAALDHAYCILVEANGGTVNRHTRFPFSEKGSRQDLEGSVKGHAKTGNAPSDKMIAVIFDEIQPYPGGKGADLVKLHVLDIADKHMVLLPTEQRTHIEDIRFEGGGGISGITLITSNAPAIVLKPGVGLEKDHQPKFALEVCFGDGQPFEGQPILPILRGLAARVDETLQLLESRAKTHSPNQ